ncbi:MAG TPA: cytochrome c oxidase subunit II [Casimicrobiaceae bacterium]|nr:cytochrome c oxidase subunit II [Casimicrobiaceae bacterium]
MQSVFNPQSFEAAAVVGLAFALTLMALVVFIGVMVLAALAIGRRPAWLARDRIVVWGGIVFPAIVLTALLALSMAMRNVDAHNKPVALRIDVVGEQWWWRVRYRDGNGAFDFETANEIRLPVGQRVELSLSSADVLHSFWVPSLAGKLDMIPGRVNRLTFTPTAAGTFRGQCAEYCGGPHAQMALYVLTVPTADFEQWRNVQRSAATATNATFTSNCAVCHTIRGTDAIGRLGPDLTHVGSRISLAAGILPNDPRSLRRWIAVGQDIKPQNLMPAFAHLPPAELDALAGYLAQLR